MAATFRQIQPAPRDDNSPESEEGGHLVLGRSYRIAKRKRQHVRVACNPCREKKRANNFNHYADIVDQLKTLPEHEALKLFQRLRSTGGAFSPLQTVRLSNHKTSQALLPTTSSRIEFELTALHGIVYPTLLPIDITRLSISPLEKPASPSNHGSLVRKSSNTPIVLSEAGSRPYCDSRLEDLDISYWTKVPISDVSAATLISLYLETDQTIIAFIDADLFLDSLVDRRPKFCSSFLVTAMLYVACYAYTAKDLTAVPLGNLFLRESERLFRAEGSADDVLTLAAINTLSLGCFYSGNDTLAKELQSAGRNMGRRLGLYGVPHDSPSSLAFRKLPDDLLRMTAHVAWSTYNWLTIHVMFFYDKSISHTPSFPVPGADRDDYPDHAWPDHPLPKYMGKSFTKLCHFFSIVEEVAAVYSANDRIPIFDRVPIAFAEAKYQKMLFWADSLSKDMAWNQDSHEHIFLFHMWFHCAVLDIFRPFTQTQQGYKLRSFNSQDSTPKTIFAASLNQMKRLVLLYRTQKMPNSYMPYINISLIHIANTICKEGPHDITSKFYFLLCIRYWQHLYVGYPIFSHVIQAFLTMAINNGLMSNREAKTLMADVLAGGKHHELAHEGIQTNFIVDFDLAMTNPDEAGVQAVAQKFEEVALFDEFAVYKKEGD
ncbi:unnamed protein product [Fusarium equiseti]|uniref:Conidial development protein fluffy n=1 Tax=Fusarium equiseti TaxID=61235 RepID=A0A8J2IVZ4_FUSEQ|nr:unnamed protein product [Fusarium equiseti]